MRLSTTVCAGMLGACLISQDAVAAPKTLPGLGDNFMGGRTVNRIQGHAQLGYSEMRFGVRIPMGVGGLTLEIVPDMRFQFPDSPVAFSLTGVPKVGSQNKVFTWSLGVGIRLQVVKKGPFAGAFTARLPLHFAFGTGPLNGAFVFGLGVLQPGFMMTYSVINKVDINFGLTFEDDIAVAGNANSGLAQGASIANLGLPMRIGTEIQVIPKLQFAFTVEAGPAFEVTSTGLAAPTTFITGRLRVLAGVAYSF